MTPDDGLAEARRNNWVETFIVLFLLALSLVSTPSGASNLPEMAREGDGSGQTSFLLVLSKASSGSWGGTLRGAEHAGTGDPAVLVAELQSRCFGDCVLNVEFDGGEQVSHAEAQRLVRTILEQVRSPSWRVAY